MSSSTSAVVRLVVGMGAKTMVGVYLVLSSPLDYMKEGGNYNVPLMGILPELKTRLLMWRTWL